MNNTTTNHNTPSRMMRLCAFALAHIAILLPLTASAAGFGGETCGRYTYMIDENKAIIIGFNDFEYEGDLVITNQLDDYTVTGIGQSAFAYRSTLTSVTIPDTVTTIEYRAFANCASLTNLFIPNSVTNIDYGADHGVVQGSPLLIHITVADDNETYADIDGVLFDKACSTLLACPNGRAGAYAIPDGVTTIVAEALRYCTALTSITLPDSLATIGKDAFEDCTSLTNITVAADNPNYASEDGVLFDNGLTTLLTCPAGFSGAYAVPDGVTAIADWAFRNRTGLTAVTLPDTVTTIGYQAFDCCTALTSITIPDSVTNISYGAFADCTALPSIIIPGSVKHLESYTFGGCESLTSVLFTGNAPTPDWYNNAFAYTSPTLTFYYLPNTKNWGAKFYGRPVVCWNPAFSTIPPPQIDASGAFAFTLTGNTDIPVRVEACDNLVSTLWVTVTNATMSSDGTLDFTDPDAASHPSRFYRFTFPH